MIKESDVRQKLIALLQHQTSLADFQDWLVERSWNMHRDSTAATRELVAAVELALAEHSAGHLDASELRATILQALDQVEVDVQIDDNITIAPLRQISTANSAPAPRRVRVPVPA